MRRKLLSLALGTLVTLVLFELGLGLSYQAFVAWQSHENASVATGGASEVRVLAIGESTTAVAGDGTGKLLVTHTAYPAQLERILNERQSQVTFRVLNNGIMGGTTSGILDLLEPAIDQFDPHLVIAMMGIKDKADMTPPGALAPAGWFQSLHTVKLVSWVRESFWLQETERVIEVGSLEEVPESLRPSRAHLTKYIRETRLSEGSPEREALDDLTLAMYLWYIGRHRRAEEILRQSIERWDVGHSLLARVLATDARRGEAEALMVGAISEHPEEAFYRVTLAELWTEEERFEEAEVVLDQALADQAGFWMGEYVVSYVHLGRAELAMAQGDPEGALAILQDLELGRRRRGKGFLPPLGFQRDTLLGEAHAALEHWSEAERHLQRAARKHPKYAATMWSLAKVYRQTGQHDEEEAIRRELLADTRRVADYFELAKLFKLSGHADAVPSLFDEAVATVPTLRTSHERLYEITEGHGLGLMVMQYPSFSLESLHRYAPVREGVTYVDNEHVFAENPDAYFYEPSFPHAFSHYTLDGAVVLAEHVADAVMERLGLEADQAAGP